MYTFDITILVQIKSYLFWVKKYLPENCLIFGSRLAFSCHNRNGDVNGARSDADDVCNVDGPGDLGVADCGWNFCRRIS